MKNLSILGSTGSIGVQTLDIVRNNPEHFKVIALTANSNIADLAAQIIEFQPQIVVVMDLAKANELERQLTTIANPPVIYTGIKGLIEAATNHQVNLVVNALVGAIGIQPTYQALAAHKDIALANKETLVAAGAIIMELAAANSCQIIPIDSEHSALLQCLHSSHQQEIEQLILTCSGGPFRGQQHDQLSSITPQQALKHPTWQMGGKISIDSATLINKGLEVIEAHHLFQVPYSKIDVTIHPQSLVHSLVQFQDGNLISQMAFNDMRVPIHYALFYPQRPKNQLPRLQFPSFHSMASQQESLESLTFEAPDLTTFPGLEMAYKAGEAGGITPAVFNAANEVAVSKFLASELNFLAIPELISKVLSQYSPINQPDLNTIIQVDQEIRTKFL